MSFEPTSSTGPTPAGVRDCARRAVLSLASLTLAVGALPLLSAPAQAAPAQTATTQAAVVETAGNDSHSQGCHIDAHKPDHTKHHGKKYAMYPFHVKCHKGYEVEVKQYYYAIDKHGKHHFIGDAYYNFHGHAWGGQHWKPLGHHDYEKTYHVVEYRYSNGHHWSHWYQDTSDWAFVGH